MQIDLIVCEPEFGVQKLKVASIGVGRFAGFLQLLGATSFSGQIFCQD
jgi:hypothetical protein